MTRTGRPSGVHKGAPSAPLRLEAFLSTLLRSKNWQEVPCAEWMAGYDKDGYPKIFLKGRTLKASRVAFLIDRGHFPQYFACHYCDNRRCVHPDHLYDGTMLQNTSDRMNSRGFIDADRVRDLRINGVSCIEGAKYLGISSASFSRLSRGLRQLHMVQP